MEFHNPYNNYTVVIDGNVSVVVRAASFCLGWRYIKFYDKKRNIMHAIRRNKCISVCLAKAVLGKSEDKV